MPPKRATGPDAVVRARAVAEAGSGEPTYVPKTGLGGYIWVIPDPSELNPRELGHQRQEGRNPTRRPANAITAAPPTANAAATPQAAP
jgi:hypothetical protein